MESGSVVSCCWKGFMFLRVGESVLSIKMICKI